MIDRYTETKHAYLAGSLHSESAIAGLALDRDFIAECDMTHGPGNVTLCARAVVLNAWRRMLVYNARWTQ